MAQLIHLNGPSGVGKSTVARMYADRHPGVLNLDTDVVVGLIGGWRDNFWEALKAGRLLAIGMAETHLSAGHDVVMPQLATKWEEVEGFQAAAERAGAEYREIVLMADKQQAIDRFAGRSTDGEAAQHIAEIVARGGGPVLLERIHDHLTAYLIGRPDCVVVPTGGRDPVQTHDAVLAALAEKAAPESIQAERADNLGWRRFTAGG
ncbi:AAA family ATPase [Kutzneria buriramensis]|uniref:AAA domain-containing protein n=1 Tax=Kutzneria buriramensis TaxID=1045776 RepID=A0A3E0I5L4_9PSEU|nr:AAA family ATPase [Kutzneria buriramensis]REH54032.1 AAA domain-containing protein [Kutzneria buriramensis]